MISTVQDVNIKPLWYSDSVTFRILATLSPSLKCLKKSRSSGSKVSLSSFHAFHPQTDSFPFLSISIDISLKVTSFTSFNPSHTSPFITIATPTLVRILSATPDLASLNLPTFSFPPLPFTLRET
ncbi:hypothetical protein E2C01_037718 [Portunus trituberculatus]|uniref:Uncharacterized protein n=1 Tax=Portunus trituberculatus TaxID=210409 RepID=A0A5B7FGJ8_PORTR|nr:hypothetical protein [Portunus trituberculatus]